MADSFNPLVEIQKNPGVAFAALAGIVIFASRIGVENPGLVNQPVALLIGVPGTVLILACVIAKYLQPKAK